MRGKHVNDKAVGQSVNSDILAIIGGFIGGAVLTVLATFLVIKWQKQRRELSYRIEIRPFLAKDEPGRPGVGWDPNVKVFYGDEEVSQLFPFKITFRNTGNQPLEHLPLKVKCDAGSEILSLMVGKSKEVEVGDILFSETNPDEREMEVGFLNEGDEIVAYGIGSSDDSFVPTVTAPQPGLRLRNRPEFWSSREALGKVLDILSEAIRTPPYM